MKQSLRLPKDISLVTTADATNPATVITLANDLKARINDMILSYNQLLQELRIIGLEGD